MSHGYPSIPLVAPRETRLAETLLDGARRFSDSRAVLPGRSATYTEGQTPLVPGPVDERGFGMLATRSELMHSWRVTRAEARNIQARLAAEVILGPLEADGPESPRYAAGVDVAYAKDGSLAWAATVVMDGRFRVLETGVAEGRPDASYAPGYLAFREGRLTLAALAGLEVSPDLIFLDGHGVVHERGLGLASHVGVLLDRPTIGIPKTPFHAIDHKPGTDRGDYYVLTKEWGAQGASIRLKARVNPVYVSPGHLVDLPSAISLVLVWSNGRRRVPEPLAAAHTLSLEARNEGNRVESRPVRGAGDNLEVGNESL